MSEALNAIRLVVIDPDAAFHQRVASLLSAQPGLRLIPVACLTSGSDLSSEESGLIPPAGQLRAPSAADLFLVGTGFGSGARLAQIGLLKQRAASIPILVAMPARRPTEAEAALRAGASGCLLSGEPPAEWVEAIRTVSRGDLFVSPALTSDLLHRALETEAPRVSQGVDSLTDRELAVLELLGAGKCTHEIANYLHLSIRTVECHREKIKHRLGLPDARALAHFACRWVDRHSQPPAAGQGTTTVTSP